MKSRILLSIIIMAFMPLMGCGTKSRDKKPVAVKTLNDEKPAPSPTPKPQPEPVKVCELDTPEGIWRIAGDSPLFTSQTNLINSEEILLIETDRIGIQVRCRTEMGNERFVISYAPVEITDTQISILEASSNQVSVGDAVCAVSLEPTVIEWTGCDDEMELSYGPHSEPVERVPAD